MALKSRYPLWTGQQFMDPETPSVDHSLIEPALILLKPRKAFSLRAPVDSNH